MQIEIDLDAQQTEIERVILKKGGKEFVLAPGVEVVFKHGVLTSDDNKGREENNWLGPSTQSGIIKSIYVIGKFRGIIVKYESNYDDLGESWSEIHTTDLHHFVDNFKKIANN